MASKNISIPESVYRKLREERRDNESFGDAISRLLGGRSLEEFWGAWSDETASGTRETLREGRRRTDAKLDDRYD